MSCLIACFLSCRTSEPAGLLANLPFRLLRSHPSLNPFKCARPLVMGSQHPSPDVKNPLQISAANWLEIITSRDAKSACFQGSQTSCTEIISGVFFAEIWPKKITSRDGCVLLSLNPFKCARHLVRSNSDGETATAATLTSGFLWVPAGFICNNLHFPNLPCTQMRLPT